MEDKNFISQSGHSELSEILMNGETEKKEEAIFIDDHKGYSFDCFFPFQYVGFSNKYCQLIYITTLN